MSLVVDKQLEPTSLKELLSIPVEDVGKVDIGRANLLCAEGLLGAEDLDVEEHVGRLNTWADRVRRLTEKYFPVYLENPDGFDNSEPQWRMLGFAKVIGQQFNVAYHEERLHSEPDWTDSQDLLLHGITGDRRKGTCASLPVLVVAICRRLGYPVCLSQAPAHCFTRWDGADHENPSWHERFNIEFHGEIGGFYDDEHYYDFPVRWPEPSRELHRRGDPSCEYLYSNTPAQEFAHSLCQRAVCLEATGRFQEAINAYYTCRKYDQRWKGYLDFAKRSLRCRAEEVMASMGYEPLRLRGWLAQVNLRSLAASAPLQHTSCLNWRQLVARPQSVTALLHRP